MMGPVQTQVTRLAQYVYPTSEHPICFQLNNPGYGLDGPPIFRSVDGDDHVQKLTQFDLVDRGLFFQAEQDHYPNGPSLYMSHVDLKFEIFGFLDYTRVRIDIVRQKKFDKQFFNPHKGNQNFMPHNIEGFAEICGFTGKEIDRSTFQVLQTKHIYFNSKGSSNPSDVAANAITVEGTTGPYKIVNMHVPLRRVFRQLESSVSETTGDDSYNLNAHSESTDTKGSYSHDNQHPLANVWCIISTDDQSALTHLIDGDAVRVNIVRKCVWRDNRA